MQAQSNKCVFRANRNCPRERWDWRRLIGKAFHRRGLATPNARLQRHVWVHGTNMWRHQMTVVNGDRQRQRVDSRPWTELIGRLEASAALWTLARPAWTELISRLEASAAAGEQAVCGRAIERRWSDVERRSGPLEVAASVHQQYHTSHETVAVVQACWHEWLDSQPTYNWLQRGFLNIAQTLLPVYTHGVTGSGDLLTYLPHPNPFCSRVPLRSLVVPASWLQACYKPTAVPRKITNNLYITLCWTSFRCRFVLHTLFLLLGLGSVLGLGFRVQNL